MTGWPTLEECLAWIDLPNPDVTLVEGCRQAAVAVVTELCRIPDELVPAPLHQSTLIRTKALYWRRQSPEGVAGFDQTGVVRVSGRDPTVAALEGPWRKVPVG